MGSIPPADQAHLPLVHGDTNPPDSVLKLRVYEAQRVAIQAMHAHDYTRAKLSAEAARRDCKLMFSRFEKLYSMGEHGAHPCTGNHVYVQELEQVFVHGQLQSYVECGDALVKAIVSHEGEHLAALEATSASTCNVEERTAVFVDAVSGPRARSASGRLVDHGVLLMIAELAVPNPDEHMWEAITHYEQYHLHATQYDSAVYRMTCTRTRYTPGLDREEFIRLMTENYDNQMHNVHYALRIAEGRQNARQAHKLRMKLISPAQRHAYDLAVREWLCAVTDGFTPQDTAAFVLTPSLSDACRHWRTKAIVIALQNFLAKRADTHYATAKRHLALQNFADCASNVRVAIDAYDLCMHCCCAQGVTWVFTSYSESMHLSKMLLRMNEELRLACVKQELARSHAARGDPQSTTLYIDKAVTHLDRHDVIMNLANPMLLEKLHEMMNDVETDDANEILEFEKTHGPVPTTVLERVNHENIVQGAARNMMSRVTKELCQSFAASMGTPSMHDATP